MSDFSELHLVLRPLGEGLQRSSFLVHHSANNEQELQLTSSAQATGSHGFCHPEWEWHGA